MIQIPTVQIGLGIAYFKFEERWHRVKLSLRKVIKQLVTLIINYSIDSVQIRYAIKLLSYLETQYSASRKTYLL
jgi:hypothetical protein